MNCEIMNRDEVESIIYDTISFSNVVGDVEEVEFVDGSFGTIRWLDSDGDEIEVCGYSHGKPIKSSRYYIEYYTGGTDNGYVRYDNRPTIDLDNAMIFDSEQEANEWIDDHSDEWKATLKVVPYPDYDEIESSRRPIKSSKENLEKAKEIWAEMEDIPINDDDEIEEDFLQFEAGTDRFEIWKWLEEKFGVSVYKDLMDYDDEEIESSRKPIKSGWERTDMASGPIWDNDKYRIIEKNDFDSEDKFYILRDKSNQRAKDIRFDTLAEAMDYVDFRANLNSSRQIKSAKNFASVVPYTISFDNGKIAKKGTSFIVDYDRNESGDYVLGISVDGVGKTQLRFDSEDDAKQNGWIIESSRKPIKSGISCISFEKNLNDYSTDPTVTVTYDYDDDRESDFYQKSIHECINEANNFISKGYECLIDELSVDNANAFDSSNSYSMVIKPSRKITSSYQTAINELEEYFECSGSGNDDEYTIYTRVLSRDDENHIAKVCEDNDCDFAIGTSHVTIYPIESSRNITSARYIATDPETGEVLGSADTYDEAINEWGEDVIITDSKVGDRQEDTGLFSSLNKNDKQFIEGLITDSSIEDPDEEIENYTYECEELGELPEGTSREEFFDELINYFNELDSEVAEGQEEGGLFSSNKTVVRQGPNFKTLDETPAEHIMKNLDTYKGYTQYDMEELVLEPSGYTLYDSDNRNAVYKKDGAEDITLLFRNGELKDAKITSSRKPIKSSIYISDIIDDISDDCFEKIRQQIFRKYPNIDDDKLTEKIDEYLEGWRYDSDSEVNNKKQAKQMVVDSWEDYIDLSDFDNSDSAVSTSSLDKLDIRAINFYAGEILKDVKNGKFPATMDGVREWVNLFNQREGVYFNPLYIKPIFEKLKRLLSPHVKALTEQEE